MAPSQVLIGSATLGKSISQQTTCTKARGTKGRRANGALKEPFDGLLYVTSHDLPQMYVLRLPAAGSSLEHVATVQIPGEGRTISWQRAARRMLWSISRARHEAIQAHVPATSVPAFGE
ncbi:hypothetical protein [Novosphingobium sp. 9U]|uniref:hypothetical protein n=1 Tax=Novosphingobium sp. 9U TaxID=2653158 RepID=UPI0012F398BD|nr:hypothetical protein [Novosphingobium sp. 9U]VWX54055.1 hypothetical protein NOVOSPHI9U_580026 [Novosphingobium sp. 9U]